MKLSAATFGEWLTGVVARHQLIVDVLVKHRSPKTWSERLASAMGKGPEYDSYLRRVAGGVISPRVRVTYEIGCGLQAAGLSWCSGALALMRNPRTFMDVLALVDIASRDETGNLIAAWFLVARSGTFELSDRPVDDATVVALLELLATFTNKIAPAMDAAFAVYEQRGLKNAHGLLGDAYLMTTDKRFARSAELVPIILEKWLAENRFSDEALVTRLTEALKAGLALAAPVRTRKRAK